MTRALQFAEQTLSHGSTCCSATRAFVTHRPVRQDVAGLARHLLAVLIDEQLRAQLQVAARATALSFTPLAIITRHAGQVLYCQHQEVTDGFDQSLVTPSRHHCSWCSGIMCGVAMPGGRRTLLVLTLHQCLQAGDGAVQLGSRVQGAAAAAPAVHA